MNDTNVGPMNAEAKDASTTVQDLSGSTEATVTTATAVTTETGAAAPDLSGSTVVPDLSGSTAPSSEPEDTPQTARIVSTATAAALPLLATLLGVVSPPFGFLMAIAAPAIVANIITSSEEPSEKTQQKGE